MTSISSGSKIFHFDREEDDSPNKAPMLILNNRPILEQLPIWFSNTKRNLALITSSSTLENVDLNSISKHFFHIETLKRYEAEFIEIAVRKFYKSYGISKLLTINERDITIAAHLRKELNIKGQSIESARAYRNKFDMKTKAAANGVTVAKMISLKKIPSMETIIEAIGFPMMIKPIDGAAAVNMSLIRNREELSTFYRLKGRCGNYLAEEFIEGDNYHVDGLMKDGLVVHSWPSRYLFTQWETMYKGRPNISGMLSPGHDLFGPLQSCAARTVEALPAPPGYCSFHAEFFNPHSNKIVLGEIACRPGGAGIVPTYQNAFGVNLQEFTLKGQAQLLDLPYIEKPGELYGWASFPPSTGILEKIPDTCDLEFVKSFSSKGMIGKSYEGPNFVTDNIAEAQFFVNGRNLLETLNRLSQWFHLNCKWEVKSE